MTVVVVSLQGNPGPPGPNGSKGRAGPRGVKVGVREQTLGGVTLRAIWTFFVGNSFPAV